MRRYKKNLKHRVGFQEFFHLSTECFESSVIVEDTNF